MRPVTQNFHPRHHFCPVDSILFLILCKRFLSAENFGPKRVAPFFSGLQTQYYQLKNDIIIVHQAVTIPVLMKVFVLFGISQEFYPHLPKIFSRCRLLKNQPYIIFNTYFLYIISHFQLPSVFCCSFRAGGNANIMSSLFKLQEI
jgi:hypothetical protein